MNIRRNHVRVHILDGTRLPALWLSTVYSEPLFLIGDARIAKKTKTTMRRSLSWRWCKNFVVSGSKSRIVKGEQLLKKSAFSCLCKIVDGCCRDWYTFSNIKKDVATFCKTPAFVPGSIFLVWVLCRFRFGSFEVRGAHTRVKISMLWVATFPRYRSLEKRCRIEVCELDCFLP